MSYSWFARIVSNRRAVAQFREGRSHSPQVPFEADELLSTSSDHAPLVPQVTSRSTDRSWRNATRGEMPRIGTLPTNAFEGETAPKARFMDPARWHFSCSGLKPSERAYREGGGGCSWMPWACGADRTEFSSAQTLWESRSPSSSYRGMARFGSEREW
jgi:hypothetical protein